MTTPGRPATAYTLRIAGHLDQDWSSWFDGLTITHDKNGTTALHGFVTDQAELHGLLDKIRDLGVTLISVTPLQSAEDPAAQEHGAQPAHPHEPPEDSSHPPGRKGETP